MPRPCSVCASPENANIDRAIVAGTPNRRVASQYNVSEIAIRRHQQSGHVAARLVDAQAAEDVRAAIDIVAQLKAVNASALRVLSDARSAGDGRLTLLACDRVLQQITVQAKLLGQLDERPVVNILATEEWVLVRTAMLDALRPFPAARLAVADRLHVIDPR